MEDVLKPQTMMTTCYMVRDDLHIPEELHDKFKEFLPCPEIMAPSVELFSDFQKKLMRRNKLRFIGKILN